MFWSVMVVTVHIISARNFFNNHHYDNDTNIRKLSIINRKSLMFPSLTGDYEMYGIE